jgi:circadian clock protein KaiB
VATVAKPKALRLRLYVAGQAPNSMRAIANARAICAQHFEGSCELEIVDLLVHPRRALDDKIIVTPTLLKLSPSPIGRVIGDLSDAAQVLLTLGGE